MRQALRILTIILTFFSLKVDHSAAFPDIRGNYIGSSTIVVSSCSSQEQDGTYFAIFEMSVDTQTDSAFSGSATNSIDLQGLTVTEYIEFSGSITESGDISGLTTHTFLETRGEGSFIGNLNGDTLTIENSGHDTFGGSCSYVRYISADRSNDSEVSLQVTGPEKIWVYNKQNPFTQFKDNPTISIEAMGTPAGGSYTWEISKGNEKVELIEIINHGDASVGVFRGKWYSDIPEDVEIRVTYFFGSKESLYSLFLTVQKATWVCEQGAPYTRTENPLFNFITTYTYKIVDQFGTDLSPIDSYIRPQPIALEIDYIDSNYPDVCLTNLLPNYFGWYSSDELFENNLTFDCEKLAGNPPDLVVQAIQNIFVSGWFVSKRHITFYNDHAISTEVVSPFPNGCDNVR